MSAVTAPVGGGVLNIARDYLSLLKLRIVLLLDATAVEADSNTLSKYDSTGIEAQVKALYQPLMDAYDRDMKIAAGN